MRDLASAMALLQYGDSFFPSGAISFSWGLEALVSEGRIISFADAWGFISGQLHGRWASFDLPLVIAAHRANSDLGAVLAHDPEGAQRRFASFESAIAIKNEVGKELAVDRIVLDGQMSGAGLIGIDGCFGAQGTFIVAGLSGSFSALEASLKSIQFPYPKATLGVSNLPNSAGLVVRILADDGVTLRLALDRAWSAARQALKGNLPSPKRK
jgi:hypothetical protein